MVVFLEGRRGEGPVAPDAGENGIRHRRFIAQDPVLVSNVVALPGEGVVRQLVDRQDVEALVVELNEAAITRIARRAIQPTVGPRALVVGNACVECQVVASRSGDLNRIELHGSESLDYAQHRLRLRRQRTRRIEELAADQEAAGVVG